MECMIIVVAHGNLANELIKTSKMLIGNYENIITFDFMPTENLESLIKKIKTDVDKVPESMSILFVVDIFSGSPFNASSYFAKNRANTKVISGVNIPMLVNIFLELPEVKNVNELVAIASNTGKDSIKFI